MADESYSRFEKLLEIKGITAYKVAKETGITTTTITNWKNGKYVPKSDKLSKIAEFLGVSESYIRTGEDKPEVPTIDWTPEHLEIMELYDKFNKEQKSAILNLMRTFALPN